MPVWVSYCWCLMWTITTKAAIWNNMHWLCYRSGSQRSQMDLMGLKSNVGRLCSFVGIPEKNPFSCLFWLFLESMSFPGSGPLHPQKWQLNHSNGFHYPSSFSHSKSPASLFPWIRTQTSVMGWWERYPAYHISPHGNFIESCLLKWKKKNFKCKGALHFRKFFPTTNIPAKNRDK